MRLFVAINFSDETRARLIALREKLRSRSTRGNFSRDENLHLTLAFIGECDERKLSSVKQAMNGMQFEPFTITIAGGGYLDKERPNLVFCEIKNDAGRNKLQRLQAGLYENLCAKGFAFEQRNFWPHITLGREVVWDNAGNYSSFIQIDWPVIKETVASIELMKSERIDGKLTYTVIYERKV